MTASTSDFTAKRSNNMYGPSILTGPILLPAAAKMLSDNYRDQRLTQSRFFLTRAHKPVASR